MIHSVRKGISKSFNWFVAIFISSFILVGVSFSISIPLLDYAIIFWISFLISSNYCGGFFEFCSFISVFFKFISCLCSLSILQLFEEVYKCPSDSFWVLSKLFLIEELLLQWNQFCGGKHVLYWYFELLVFCDRTWTCRSRLVLYI